MRNYGIDLYPINERYTKSINRFYVRGISPIAGGLLISRSRGTIYEWSGGSTHDIAYACGGIS